ncbi:hypothetical protein [Ruegeria sp. A3M17]|uniref:hypothetical protein n=1 Tax=Ruegeria sp. A3M17 TaxID=2267229 RepID=UPI0018F45550|nr:hypothetical protein [Ruegeria sp. A3M17]
MLLEMHAFESRIATATLDGIKVAQMIRAGHFGVAIGPFNPFAKLATRAETSTGLHLLKNFSTKPKQNIETFWLPNPVRDGQAEITQQRD